MRPSGQRWLQRLQQPPQLRVDEGDLAGVGVVRKRARIPRRRLVLGVRVVEVHPQEEARGRCLDPGDRRVHHGVRVSLRATRVARSPAGRHLIVVAVEAAGQAELAFQDHGAHEGGRLEPGGAHPLGERRKIRFEAEDQVVADTVVGWIEGRHQRGVRGERERCRRERRFEAHSFRGDAVQRRGARPLSSVAAQPIRPERVDGDEDHPLGPAAAAACRGGGRQKQQEEGAEPTRRRPRYGI